MSKKLTLKEWKEKAEKLEDYIIEMTNCFKDHKQLVESLGEAVDYLGYDLYGDYNGQDLDEYLVFMEINPESKKDVKNV